jgi:hypothetical protein
MPLVAQFGGMGGFGGGGGSILRNEAFDQVGHCLLALIFAVIGGTLARILFTVPLRSVDAREAAHESPGAATWEGWLRPVAIGLTGVAVIVLIGVIRPRSTAGLAAGTIYMVTCGVLGLAMLGAALGEGRPGQIWLGAAIFGTGYMLLVFGREANRNPKPYLPTDRLLAEMRPWLPRVAEGIGVSSKVEAANARILKALDEPISMSFAMETPLDDVLKYIRTKTRGEGGNGIPIYVDPIGLQEAEKSLTSTVSIDLENVPLATTLHICLKQLGLAYGIRDGFLMITSSESVPPLYEDPFLMTGHCLLALIAAAAGGVLAPVVAGARTRQTR